MPAQFTLDAQNFKTVLRELNKVEPGSRKAMQDELKDRLNPIVDRLQKQVPSQPPLSGLAPRRVRRPTGRRGNSTSRFQWTPVTGKTVTPFSKRTPVRGSYQVVSMRFKSRGKAAGFEIVELAGSKSSGMTAQGRAFIANLNARYPIKGGLGRFIIPASKNEQGDAVRISRAIIERYVQKVNRRLR